MRWIKSRFNLADQSWRPSLFEKISPAWLSFAELSKCRVSVYFRLCSPPPLCFATSRRRFINRIRGSVKCRSNPDYNHHGDHNKTSWRLFFELFEDDRFDWHSPAVKSVNCVKNEELKNFFSRIQRADSNINWIHQRECWWTYRWKILSRDSDWNVFAFQSSSDTSNAQTDWWKPVPIDGGQIWFPFFLSSALQSWFTRNF